MTRLAALAAATVCGLLSGTVPAGREARAGPGSGRDAAPWFERPQFLAYFTGFEFSPDQRLGEVPFTGQAWGVHFPNRASDADLAREVAAWRTRGGVYFASINFANVYDVPLPEWDAFRMRTIDGALLDAPGGWPRYTLSSATFREFLLRQARRAVDVGCDGVLIDDVTGQLISLLYLAPRAAGSFDAATMTAFRDHLRVALGDAALLARFGITDPSTFDLGDHLRTAGLADMWNRLPLDGLALEFFRFRRIETLAFLRELAAATRAYALARDGRAFAVTCNTAYDPLGDLVRDAVDFTTNEGFYIRGRTHPFLATDIRAWRDWRQPQLVLPEPFPPALGVTDPLDRPTANLMRAVIADTQAAGGVAGTTLDLNVGLGSPQPVDLAVVRRYAAFILDNPQLMAGLTAPASAALLESAPSRLGGRVLTSGESDPWAGPGDHDGTARLLLDAGIAYRSVFLPDLSYSKLPSPDPTALAAFSAVLAPSVWALDDGQVAALLTYVHAGGTLLVSGSLGTSMPDGSAAERPALRAALPAAGAAAYGAGRIVVAPERFGVAYELGPESEQRAVRERFVTFVGAYLARDVVITQPAAVRREPGLVPFLYRDRGGLPVVHLVNHDYDESSDSFSVKRAVTVNVRVGAQPVDAVVLRSPDVAGAAALPFVRAGDTVAVTVPEIEAWAVLALQPDTGGPVITGSSPPSPVYAVGGAAVTFSVAASDPDGSALSCRWSLDGTAIGEAGGTAWTWRLPRDAAGTHAVRAEVSDGVHTAVATWTVGAVPYRAPHVLFDEAHGERNTVDAARAVELAPENPGWVSLVALRDALSPAYVVSRHAAGPLTAAVLAGVDVLVLAAPVEPLAPAEVEAVRAFARSGRGLVVLADAWLGPAVDGLLAEWGVRVEQPPVFSPEDPGCPGCFRLRTFADHPAAGTLPVLRANYGASLTVSSPAVAIGWSPQDSWRSVSGGAARQPGDPGGPFTMVAVATVGRGRVFVVSDNAFHDDYLRNDQGNLRLFEAGLAWVAEPVNARRVHRPAVHLGGGAP